MGEITKKPDLEHDDIEPVRASEFANTAADGCQRTFLNVSKSVGRHSIDSRVSERTTGRPLCYTQSRR